MAIVNQLVRHLQDPSVEVFVAEYSVRPGEKLNATIMKAIKECDHFVLLWSKNSKGSEYVSQEIALALNNDKDILPIVLDEGLHLPGFINDLKYLPAYKGLNESMQWTQNYLSDTAKKSERDKGWAIIGLVAGAIVLFGRK
jgi:hypothetical protein